MHLRGNFRVFWFQRKPFPRVGDEGLYLEQIRDIVQGHAVRGAVTHMMLFITCRRGCEEWRGIKWSFYFVGGRKNAACWSDVAFVVEWIAVYSTRREAGGRRGRRGVESGV